MYRQHRLGKANFIELLSLVLFFQCWIFFSLRASLSPHSIAFSQAFSQNAILSFLFLYCHQPSPGPQQLQNDQQQERLKRSDVNLLHKYTLDLCKCIVNRLPICIVNRLPICIIQYSFTGTYDTVKLKHVSNLKTGLCLDSSKQFPLNNLK